MKKYFCFYPVRNVSSKVLHYTQSKRKQDIAAGRPVTYIVLPLILSAGCSYSIVEEIRYKLYLCSQFIGFLFPYNHLCILLIKEYLLLIHIWKRTYTKCRERFIRKYPNSPVPIKPCLSNLKKWWTTGSVLHKMTLQEIIVHRWEAWRHSGFRCEYRLALRNLQDNYHKS
jgi:hypothetical protein